MRRALRTRKVWTGTALLIASVAALLAAGWQFLPGNAWSPEGGPVIIDPVLATDLSDDRKLVGISGAVFFGKVTPDGVDSDVYPYPTVTYQVEVLETLKGTASGTVQVNQPAHFTKNGDPIYFEHAGEALENGKTYVFVGDYIEDSDWYIVHTSYQQVAVSAPEGAPKDEVLRSDHANELRTRFNNAIENEIPYDPTSSYDERQEQREKGIAAKDPALLPLCIAEDLTGRPDPVPAKSTEP